MFTFIANPTTALVCWILGTSIGVVVGTVGSAEPRTTPKLAADLIDRSADDDCHGMAEDFHGRSEDVFGLLSELLDWIRTHKIVIILVAVCFFVVLVAWLCQPAFPALLP